MRPDWACPDDSFRLNNKYLNDFVLNKIRRMSEDGIGSDRTKRLLRIIEMDIPVHTTPMKLLPQKTAESLAATSFIHATS
jgi:hypothetical protein